MLSTQCLERQTISSFLQGNLDAEQSDPVIAHLDQCHRCEAVAQELEGHSDWLLRHVRAAGRDDTLATVPEWLSAVRDIVSAEGESEVSASEPAEDVKPPLRLGAYEIKSVLGRGGMGIVYRAVHERLRSEVALKIVHLAGPESEVRFDREMRTVAALDHPTIIRATDAGTANGYTYLAMERIVGADLGRVLRQFGPLRIADACEIAKQVALGLDSAHQSGVVHRDVKPSNIMLTVDGQVKILDFGLAKAHAEVTQASFATSMGRLLGTLDYLAPEQTETTTVDHRADVYSLGATLFALLAGRPPLGRASDASVIQHLQRLATAEPPRIRTLRDEVPEDLADLIQRMLSRESEDRPPTAADVALALEPYARDADLTELMLDIALPEDEPLSEDVTRGHEFESEEEGVSENARPAPSEVISRAGRIWKSIIGAFLGLILVIGGGLSGIVIYLETGEGTLRVESNVDDVRIRVRRENDRGGKSIEVRQSPEGLQLRAGVYRVDLVGQADDIEISANRVRVMRNEDVVLLVTREPGKGAPKPAGGGIGGDVGVAPKPLEKGEPTTLMDRLASGAGSDATWKGQSAAQWLNVYRTELEAERQAEASSALIALSSRLPDDEAGLMLLEVASPLARRFNRDNPKGGARMILTQRRLWHVYEGRGDSLSKDFQRSVKYNDGFMALSAKLAALSPDTLASLLRSTDQQAVNGRDVLLHAILSRATAGLGSADEEKAYRAALLANVRPGVRTPGIAEFVVDLIDPTSTPDIRGYLASKPEKVIAYDSILASLLALRFLDDVPREQIYAHVGFALRDQTDELGESIYNWAHAELGKDDPRWVNAVVDPIIELMDREIMTPGFPIQLAESQYMLLVSLPFELSDSNDLTPANQQKIVEWADRCLEKMVKFRDEGKLPEGSDPLVIYDRVGMHFESIALLRIVMSGEFPDILKQAPVGDTLIRKWLTEFDSRPSDVEAPKLEGGKIQAIGRWYPLHTIASGLGIPIEGVPGLGKDRAARRPGGLGIDTQYVTQVAVMSELAGHSRDADQVIRQSWGNTSRQRGASMEIEFGHPAGTDFVNHWRGLYKEREQLDGLLIAIAEKTTDDLLRLMVLTAATSQADISDLADRLLEPTDLQLRIWAIRLLAQYDLLEGREAKVVELLTASGFKLDPQLRQANFRHHDNHCISRVVMLHEFSDELLRPHVPTILGSLPRQMPFQDLFVVDLQGRRKSIGAAQAMLQIVNRFPDAIRQNREVAQRFFLFYQPYRSSLNLNPSGRRLIQELDKLIAPLKGAGPNLQGTITAELDNQRIAISIGADDGVKIDQTFEVYRGNVWLGAIRVETQTPDSAFAKVIAEGRGIDVGDTIVSVFTKPRK